MTTLQTVQEILKANFDLGPVVPQQDAALEDLDIDSLAVIELLFEVEEKFGITVPSEPAATQARLKTIGDLVAYIDELIAAQNPVGARAEPAP